MMWLYIIVTAKKFQIITTPQFTNTLYECLSVVQRHNVQV